MEKVACFIDAGYLDNVAKNFLDVDARPVKFNYQKIVDVMRNGRSLLRTYYYTCPVFLSNPPTQDERNRQSRQNSFFNRLISHINTNQS